MSSLRAHLKDLLAELSAELPEVTEQRMFGSDAFFAQRVIYALVWQGRICLKFPDEARLEQARALEGADSFDPMGRGRTTGKWVVMPEALSDDVDGLRPWVEEAHREAMQQPTRPLRSRAPARRKARSPAARTSRAAARRGSR